MCTVSKRERQFDKWHPFHAYTGAPGPAGGCNQSYSKLCPKWKNPYLCDAIDLPTTLVTPLNPHLVTHFGPLVGGPAELGSADVSQKLPRFTFSGFPLSDSMEEEGGFVAIEEAASPWGHGAMTILTMQILDGKLRAGHHTFHRS